MKDIRSVLAEKEAEHKRVWSEVLALRYAIKACSEASDPPLPATSADAVIDSWPGIAAVEKPKAQFP